MSYNGIKPGDVFYADHSRYGRTDLRKYVCKKVTPTGRISTECGNQFMPDGCMVGRERFHSVWIKTGETLERLMRQDAIEKAWSKVSLSAVSLDTAIRRKDMDALVAAEEALRTTLSALKDAQA